MLVEDDMHDVEAMRIALRRAESSYQLVTVSNGRDAIKYLSRADHFADRKRFPDPCLVLLDLSLPLVTGFEVLAWMQNETQRDLPPVVVLSYSRLEHDRRLALKLGARGYYVKSPDLNATVALVRSLLVLNFLPAGAPMESLQN